MERKVQRASESYFQNLGKKLQLLCYSSLYRTSDLVAIHRTSACRSSSVLAANLKATRLVWLNDAPAFAPYYLHASLSEKRCVGFVQGRSSAGLSVAHSLT